MVRKYILPTLKIMSSLILFVIFYAIFSLILNIKVGNNNIPVLKDFAEIISAGLVTLLYLKIDKIDIKDIGISIDKNFLKYFLYNILGFIGLFGIVICIFNISGVIVIRNLVDIKNIAETYENIIKLFCHILSMTLILYGYVYTHLKDRDYTKLGISIIIGIILSIMMVVYNISDYIPMYMVFFYIMMGIVFTAVRAKYDNVWSIFWFWFLWEASIYIFNIDSKGSNLISGGTLGLKYGMALNSLFIIAIICMFIIKYAENMFIEGIKVIKNAIVFFAISLFGFSLIYQSVSVWSTGNLATNSKPLNEVKKMTRINDYTMNLNFNPKNRTISSEQSLDYINKSTDSLKEMYFHIYPNAFKKYDGSIKINEVKINNESLKYNVEYKIEGKDKTLLKVSLKNELKPNEKTKVYINYIVTIPNKKDRFGFGNGIYAAGNVFPIVAVYKNGQWDKHLYDEKGDAFFSDVSNFDVTITTPKKYLVATSGVIKSDKVINDKVKRRIEAYNVRDFAFVTSDLFCLKTGNVDGIKVQSYGTDPQRTEKALEIGISAMKYFDKNIGKYPYPSVVIAEAGMAPGIGAMEYPNLVMIGSGEYNDISYIESLSYSMIIKGFTPKQEFYECIIHELAHQWWYALVGNDEYREAWIDEPMTQYSTMQYLKDTYGKKYTDSEFGIWKFASKSVNDKSMLRPLNKYDDDEYGLLLYEKGPLMWKALNEQVGEKKFREFQRELFESYKYKNAATSDVINTASKVFKKDMKPFFDKWLKGE